MWNLNFERIFALIPGARAPLAVESGTCRGNGARGLSRHFSRVITIELSEELHLHARERLFREGCANVECVQGSSAEVLCELLPGLSADQPTFFFLDAHWSGDESVDWSRSEWRGYGLNTAHLGASLTRPEAIHQCPLADELRSIMKHCRGSAQILVDDMKNLPASGPGRKDHTFAGEDWSHLSRELLLEIVGPRLERVHELQAPEQWLLVLKPAC